MNRFWMMALALTASLLSAASVQARGPVGFRPSGRPSTSHNNLSRKPVFTGKFYKGVGHQHLSYTYWDGRYGCYLYWDPSAPCYYYWCAPAGCYYPVSYCPYNTFCWQKPVGGVLPPPVVSGVPTVQTGSLGKAPGVQGPAPTPPSDLELPTDAPPPISQGGSLAPGQ